MLARVLAVTALVLVLDAVQASAELRQALGRPEIIEIGSPMLISRELLEREARQNSELRSWIRVYGWPDYAEVQEVTIREPLAAYEVRLYYIDRNQQIAFSRVHVSPALQDFGIRTYDGPIPKPVLDRILTASEPAARVLAESR